MRATVGILLIGFSVAIGPVHGGIFGKKEKDGVDPTHRVLELVQALQNNPDANKRAEAAEQLKTFNATEFPEILPALINALQSDTSTGVRRAAASALGKLRPTSAEADDALGHAAKKDKSFWVRWQAKSARLGYDVPKAPADAKEAPAKPPLPPARASRPMPRPAPPKPGDGRILSRPPQPPPDSGPILEPWKAAPPRIPPPIPKSATEVEGPILIPPKPE